MKRLAFLAALALAGCATTAPYPPQADVIAVTESKPKPSAAVLTDPAASDRHNAAIESWGERLQAAGVRLCRFLRGTGMDVECR